MHKHVIIPEGPPGSGKDTQMKGIHGIAVIPMGERLRARAKSGDLPSDIKAKLDQGILLPNSEVTNLLEAGLEEYSLAPRIFLNGYPRTLEQAIILRDILDERYEDDFTVTCIRLNVSLETCSKRAANRRAADIEAGREPRVDDDPFIVDRRLREYQVQSAKMLPYLRENTNFMEIDGELPEKEVFHQIQQCLMKLDIVAVERVER